MPQSITPRARRLLAGVILLNVFAVAAAAHALVGRLAATPPGHREDAGQAPLAAPEPQRVYVDRIESGRAVLLMGAEGREYVTIPARLLPRSTREGAALDLILARTADGQTGAETYALLRDLTHHPAREARR